MMPSLLAIARRYAEEAAPAEACGLIVVQLGSHVGDYWPARNISPELDRFAIHPEDWAAAEDMGRIAAVVHSHPGGSTEPSPADVQACNLSGVPWVILGEGDSWKVLQPEGVPLEGREFCWGVSDCYSLVRDWFKQHGIVLADFPRTPDFWRREDLFGAGLAQAGFKPVPDSELQNGDGLLFSIRGLEVTNHCGIFLGNGRMLHHLPGRLSIAEPIGAWVRSLKGVVRYGF
jgi:proteasome lid subunit RPN8/RPN11